MDTAAAQLRRILHLIPTLADDREHSIDEVARLAGVSRKVLVSDLKSLSQRFDDPGGFVEGVSIFIEKERVSVHANHFLRPMRLTRQEIAALELGLAMLRGERPPEEQRAIDGARERLSAAAAELPDDARAAHETWRVGEPLVVYETDADHRAVLRTAVTESRKARIVYHKAADAEAAARVVCPHALVFAVGMWYVVAHCEESGGLRFFRMDRVEEVELLDDTFVRTDGFSVDDVVNGPMFRAEETRAVTIRYSPGIARWIAEREGRALAEDGSLTMELACADTDWAVRHVLQYGPDAEVVGPDDVRERVREVLSVSG